MDVRRWTAVGLVVLVLGAAGAGDAESPPALEDLAAEYVSLLADGRFDEAAARHDATMSSVMPAAKLRAVWQQVRMQAGDYREQLGIRIEQVGGYDAVFVRSAFERALLDIRVVFDAERLVTGLFFHPVDAAASAAQPEKAADAAWTERAVTVGRGDWLLPGLLTQPAGPGPFPAVVLVHGSGPHDRDESVGPNKPFRDLAHGLARRGVAVLRYDKRTHAHKAKLSASPPGPFTVREEVLDDVVAATALVREQPMVRADAVFVAGHSLGGTLVPRIAKRDRELAGFVILAGTPRDLVELIVPQYEYVINLDGTVSEQEQAQLARISADMDRVRRLTADSPPGELLAGAPASYWLDLKGYRAGDAIGEVARPLLVLQGGRDYQITMEDFAGWKAALSSRDDASFKVYPKLNHLFMPGEGPANPQEYFRPGHVSEEVIEDIAEWVLAHVPATAQN